MQGGRWRREVRHRRRPALCRLADSKDLQGEAPLDMDEETEFSNWVQGLNQWPLRPESSNRQQQQTQPSDSSSSQQKSQTMSSPSRSQPPVVGGGSGSLQNPLSSLLDIEALLQLEKFEPERQAEKLLSSIGQGIGDSTSATSSAALNSILQVGESVLNVTDLEELSAWTEWVGSLQNRISEQLGGGAKKKSQSPVVAERKLLDGILQQATMQIESFISEATNILTTDSIEDFVVKASQVIEQGTSTNTTSNLIAAAKEMAVERGLDVYEAAERAKEAIEYSTTLVTVADQVIRNGYVPGDSVADNLELPKEVPKIDGSRALFADFVSATELSEYSDQVGKAAEMGLISGAIYEETIQRMHNLGHTIVSMGVSEDVRWMISDSVAPASSFDESKIDGDRNKKQLMIRTISIRGYDASDENVDRELLLNRICTAQPEKLKSISGLSFHSGLLGIARGIYRDIKQYVDWTAPNHKIVLTGHSVGGSLSLLLMFLMAQDRGIDFVRKKILRVYTFGSPPVVRLDKEKKPPQTGRSGVDRRCEILDKVSLPPSLVEGYVQPWDPIVRLFTPADPLYPLVDDIAADGVTLYSSGPPRTLRPVTKAIFQAWEGWPGLRKNFTETGSQTYVAAGIQHVLVPEPTRYLADRFVAVNIPVPPTEALVQLNADELLPALEKVFPLDEFEISFVPTAVRSFVHHFYPAYGSPFADYVKFLKKRELSGEDATTKSDVSVLEETSESHENKLVDEKDNKDSIDTLLGLNKARKWLQRNEG